jgi:nucleotide-binding universal stress UspA family protein
LLCGMARYFLAFDGSDSSRGAFDRIRGILSPSDTIVVVSVVESFMMYDSSSGTPVEDDINVLAGAINQSQIDALREEQQKLVSSLENVKHEFVVCVHPDPREGLLKETVKWGADVLVIGSRGLSGIERFILSSTSDFCIQNATIPVLVIPPTAQHFTAPKPLRYLVAYDGSDGSKGALDQTLFLSSADSTILVLSLIESFTMFDSSGVPLENEGDCDAVNEAHLASVKDSQNSIVAKLGDRKHELHTSLVSDTREGLLQEAKRLDADIIVVGSRGLSTISRLLLGSTSEFLIHHSPIPVIVVPPLAQHWRNK